MMAGGIIQDIKISAYTLPTDLPESDGTLEWNSTTLVLVELTAQDRTGIGYTYSSPAAAAYIRQKLQSIVTGQNPFDIEKIHADMLTAIRNDGHCGLAMMALSAIDTALWDLKAKILDLPLCELIGRADDAVNVYGSGGFTSYSDTQLENQLGVWASDGFSAVKMKIGRNPENDIARVHTARAAIGESVELFVDANGAFNSRQALRLTEFFKNDDISWFEEPVSSDDRASLHFIRQQISPHIRIAAGEYGYSQKDFLALLQHEAVDILQADATRCGGITGFLKAGKLAETFHVPFSFHCAPALHLHAAIGLPGHEIGEYFHDHARIENILFDGAIQPQKGQLKPNLSSAGMGLTFKRQDAEKYKL